MQRRSMLDLDLRTVSTDRAGTANILATDCVLVFMTDHGVRFTNIVELEMDTCLFPALSDLLTALPRDAI